MKNPLITISWGELFDKITILKLKSKKMTSPEALKNVSRELKQLRVIFDKEFKSNAPALNFEEELGVINDKLWNIEDQIRDKERSKIFDYEFVQLARSVYVTNDRRAAIKKEINKTFGSHLVEEQSYAKY